MLRGRPKPHTERGVKVFLLKSWDLAMVSQIPFLEKNLIP